MVESTKKFQITCSLLDIQHTEHIGRVERVIFYLVFPCEGGILPKNSFLGAIMLRQNIADPHHATIQTQLWANHQELGGRLAGSYSPTCRFIHLQKIIYHVH